MQNTDNKASLVDLDWYRLHLIVFMRTLLVNSTEKITFVKRLLKHNSNNQNQSIKINTLFDIKYI